MVHLNTFLVLSVICFLWISHVHSHNRVLSLINKRFKSLNVSMSNLEALLNGLTDEVQQCDSGDVTSALDRLSAKIDGLGGSGGNGGGVPDETIVIGNDSSVRVNAPVTFQQCIDEMDEDHKHELNAKIWCLRVVLWQKIYYEKFDEPVDGFDVSTTPFTPTTLEENIDDSDDESTDGEVLSRKKRRTNRRGRQNLNLRRYARRGRILGVPRTGKRIRKEYRSLTDRERNDFHEALQLLYEDGTIDCFNEVHRNALRSGGAHRGPAFLPWHRAFITLFEEALRRKIPSVFLPYWDSTIDDNMATPGLSVMWHDDYMGNLATGSPIFDTGPFRGWETFDGSPLTRNIASGAGSPIRQSRINDLMDLCFLRDFDNRWESAHDAVHRWVGGAMATGLAAGDPIFYLHHCFIDYQWERFREHQNLDCDVDPYFDYPSTSITTHQANDPMDGMEFFNNVDGIKPFWTNDWFEYEDTPTCPFCDNTNATFCDRQRVLCTGEIIMAFQDVLGDVRKKRSTNEDISGRKAVSASDRDNCRQNPYASNCNSKSPVPETAEEIAKAMVHGELDLPPDAKAIDTYLKRMVNISESFPPLSHPTVFRSPGDDQNDCRTMETCVFDLLTATYHGTEVSGGRYKHR